MTDNLDPGPESPNWKSKDWARYMRKVGAVLVRKAKHGDVYRLPNGRKVQFSISPSDWRVGKNKRAEVRRLLSEPKGEA